MPSSLRVVALVAPALVVGLLAAPSVRPTAAEPVVLGSASAALDAAPLQGTRPAVRDLPQRRLVVTTAPHVAPRAAAVAKPAARASRPATQRVLGRPAPAALRARTGATRVRAAAESPQAYADRRGRALLESFGYPVERLGYDIVFRPYAGSLMGTADSATRRITVYVRRGQSDFSLRVVLAHEVGHVVDLLTSTSQSRASYLAERGLDPQTPWYPCHGCSDYASPAGDFAEVFALWWAGPGDFRSRLAGPPPADQLADLGLRFFQPPA